MNGCVRTCNIIGVKFGVGQIIFGPAGSERPPRNRMEIRAGRRMGGSGNQQWSSRAWIWG